MKLFQDVSHLPNRLPLPRASFSSAWGIVKNIQRSASEGHEYVAFDYDSNSGETAETCTVLAVNEKSLKVPETSLSRAAGLKLERVGDWIFAWEPRRSYSPDKVHDLVDEVRNLIEYAKGFPQNT
jgi:hypothetical protein